MSTLKSYDYPGFGEFAREAMAYTQAIRVGDRIHCSGQGNSSLPLPIPTILLILTLSGGWDPATNSIDIDNPATFVKSDLAEEIDQAFANCDLNLKHAGGQGWSQVYRIVTYSTNTKLSFEHIVRNLKKWMPDHKPIVSGFSEHPVRHSDAARALKPLRDGFQRGIEIRKESISCLVN